MNVVSSPPSADCGAASPPPMTRVFTMSLLPATASAFQAIAVSHDINPNSSEWFFSQSTIPKRYKHEKMFMYLDDTFKYLSHINYCISPLPTMYIHIHILRTIRNK